MVHPRTWDRASASIRSTETWIFEQIWSSIECQPVEVLFLESGHVVGLVSADGTLGVVEVQDESSVL